MRRLQAFIAILILSALCASAASTFELVMFRRDGCPWCAAWDRELGPIYGKTEIGQRVPIPVRFTPTFVLLDGDREIGRIEGYPGPDFFWGLLENLVSKSGAAPGERRVPAGYWSLRTNTDER